MDYELTLLPHAQIKVCPLSKEKSRPKSFPSWTLYPWVLFSLQVLVLLHLTDFDHCYDKIIINAWFSWQRLYFTSSNLIFCWSGGSCWYITSKLGYKWHLLSPIHHSIWKVAFQSCCTSSHFVWKCQIKEKSLTD